MTGGRKPSARISARLKNAPKGTKGTPVMAVWRGRFGWDVSLDKDVERIVMKDGTVISGQGRDGTHWLDLHAFEALSKSESRGERERAKQDEGLVEKYGDDYGSGGDPDDSIPFAEREEWGS